MSRVCVAAAALVCVIAGSICLGQQLTKRMTNQDVIEMGSLGLSDEVIIEKIRATPATEFDTSIEGLKALKAAKVSNAVIRVMVNPHASTEAAADSPAQPGNANGTATPGPQSSPLAVPDDPGVFVQGASAFISILGQPVQFARSGSVFASKITAGIKAQHSNAQISGIHAHTITTSTPVFLFIPSQRETENGVTVADLVLVTLDVRGDRRQIELGAAGAGRESSGVTLTHQVDTVKSQRASHKYEIKPAEPLKRGEYAFYLARGEGLPPMLYDFSVE